MKSFTRFLFIVLQSMVCLIINAQSAKVFNAIYSGIPWFENRGKEVSAHGGCIIKEKNRFYFFGEKHSDTSNVFNGFNCYSSTDLYNWKFESIALPVQPFGKLGPNRVGERVKVMKCPSTGEYVMYLHVDTLGYKDQFVGYATSKNITGPYNFKGPLLFNGQLIRKWDMGTFQDFDGEGYILIHGGEIYRLKEDYKSIAEQTNPSITSGFESPTLFRKDNIYFLIGSHLTSWERNDNEYYTARSIKGPWTLRGIFAPAGTLTWNSQATFVLPIKGSTQTAYLFMGDRWSYPKQASAATYVWQPLTVTDSSITIPRFFESWQINTSTGNIIKTKLSQKTIDNNNTSVHYSGKWNYDSLFFKNSNEKGSFMSFQFKGTGIGFYGLARPDGGYALVEIQNKKGKKILSSIVDMYSKYPNLKLAFLGPVLPLDNYTITVTVLGERSNWSDKRKTDYGSTGYFVSLEKLVITE